MFVNWRRVDASSKLNWGLTNGKLSVRFEFFFRFPKMFEKSRKFSRDVNVSRRAGHVFLRFGRKSKRIDGENKAKSIWRISGRIAAFLQLDRIYGRVRHSRRRETLEKVSIGSLRTERYFLFLFLFFQKKAKRRQSFPSDSSLLFLDKKKHRASFFLRWIRWKTSFDTGRLRPKNFEKNWSKISKILCRKMRSKVKRNESFVDGSNIWERRIASDFENSFDQWRIELKIRTIDLCCFRRANFAPVSTLVKIDLSFLVKLRR